MTEAQKSRRFILLILLAKALLISGLIIGLQYDRHEHQFDYNSTPSKKEDTISIVVTTTIIPVVPTVQSTPVSVVVPTSKPSTITKPEVTYERMDPIDHRVPKSNILTSPSPLDMLYIKQMSVNNNYQTNTIVDNPTRREIQSIKFDHTPSQITTYYHVTIK